MATMGEVGRIGQRRYGGVFQEEFLKELRGKKGIEVYREMSENDDIVGAVLYSLEMLIRQARWYVQPAKDTGKDKECAEFVESCMHDMQDSWTDTLSEILSFLTYGWAYHEIVYKRRMGDIMNPQAQSKYSDGLIGWQKLPIRAQESLFAWDYDLRDNLLGMIQSCYPNYAQINIPIQKSLHFKTKSRKNNPEGRSILRNAYRSWYFKRRMQELEGIGIERDLAGLPVLTAPTGVDIWDSDDPDMVKKRIAAETIVRNIRRDAVEGIVLPGKPSNGEDGWALSLLTTGGRRQFDTNAIIERYDTRIAMCTLADFILLGHQKVGSFALSSDKTQLFSVAIGAYLDIVCEAMNKQAIPRLIAINSDHFKGITDLPKLCHGDVEAPNLSDLGSFIRDMTGCGAIIPDDGLEKYLREAANLPERTDDQLYDADARRQQQQHAKEDPGEKKKVNPEDLEPDDMDEVEAAKKRLSWGG